MTCDTKYNMVDDILQSKPKKKRFRDKTKNDIVKNPEEERYMIRFNEIKEAHQNGDIVNIYNSVRLYNNYLIELIDPSKNGAVSTKSKNIDPSIICFNEVVTYLVNFMSHPLVTNDLISLIYRTLANLSSYLLPSKPLVHCNNLFQRMSEDIPKCQVIILIDIFNLLSIIIEDNDACIECIYSLIDFNLVHEMIQDPNSSTNLINSICKFICGMCKTHLSLEQAECLVVEINNILEYGSSASSKTQSTSALCCLLDLHKNGLNDVIQRYEFGPLFAVSLKFQDTNLTNITLKAIGTICMLNIKVINYPFKEIIESDLFDINDTNTKCLLMFCLMNMIYSENYICSENEIFKILEYLVFYIENDVFLAAKYATDILPKLFPYVSTQAFQRLVENDFIDVVHSMILFELEPKQMELTLDMLKRLIDVAQNEGWLDFCMEKLDNSGLLETLKLKQDDECSESMSRIIFSFINSLPKLEETPDDE